MEIERALADLRQAVKVPLTADSAERATAADYQMIINFLEEMLAGVEAPHPDLAKLHALQKEVQRIVKTVQHRLIGRMNAAADAVASGASLDEFLRPQTNLAKVVSIIDELSKRIIAAASRRTAERSQATEAREPIVVDSPQPTEDDAAMSTPTQSEIDLKIENMQLRMDGRLSSIEGKMDALANQVAGAERAMSLLAERAVAAAESAAASADRASNLKQTLWVTSVSTILSVLGIALALYFGIQSSNLAIVQTTLSAFEAGRDTPQGQAESPAPQAPATAQPPAK